MTELNLDRFKKASFLSSLEVREFILNPRCLHFVPLLFFGVFLIAWAYPVMPAFVPVVVVVFGGLEPQYCNMFFRSPHELEALAVLSADWKQIIIVKNVATVFLTVITLLAMTATLFFFSPEVYLVHNITSGMLFMSVVLFPMLHIGNMRSIGQPRRDCGWQVNDFVEMLWMVATLLVAAIPYWLFAGLLHMPGLCIAYGIATVVHWYLVSVPRTVRGIIEHHLEICGKT